MTKKEQKAIQVAERKVMREKFAHSQFLSRTRSIYNGQKTRAEKDKKTLSFTMEELREVIRPAIGLPDVYNPELKVTVKNMTVDHEMPIARGGSYDLANLVVTTQPSNYQKGVMTGREFRALMQYVVATLPPNVVKDIRARLTTGGKFNAKRF